MAVMDMARSVEALRRFSRFYTRRIEVLDEGLLRSPFSLSEGRIIYELAQTEGQSATELCQRLGIDAGYASRILAGLEERGVVERAPSPDDGRVRLVSLTGAGRDAFAALDAASRAQATDLLSGLSDEERADLVDAMGAIERILDDGPPAVPFILRPPTPGDMGWMVQSQGAFYAEAFGWGHEFEGLAAEIVGRFLTNFDPARERCWIAEREGRKVGSVFVCARSQEVAQLRMLYVDAEARGLGIGRRLVQECTRFARQAGYGRIMLWTNRGLDAARRIYEAEGYTLVREEPHTSFGHELVGQYWELEL